MICPQCKCEYVRGVTQCADCGVPLVDALEPESPAISADARLVTVWRGTDRAEYEKVTDALENADIPYTKANSTSLFGSRPNESFLEIWVAEADREKAEEAALSFDDTMPAEELTPEQAAALSLPESDGPDEDEEPQEDLAGEIFEDDPVSDVWTGDDESVADNLTMCLREIGIASRKITESGRWRVAVRPEAETRAREIVREVVEASPPQ